MSNEFTLTSSLKLANGDLDSLTIPSRTQRVDQDTATPFRVDGFQDIGTAAAGEALDLTGLTTNGLAHFWNRDATNFVEIGVQVGGTFYPLLRVEKGESFIVRLAQGIAPYARADTGSCYLERTIFDD